MNEEIKLLPTGDFEVQYAELREFERRIKEAMTIPAPMLERQSLYAWELDQESLDAIANAKPSPECLLCEMGIPLSTPRRVVDLDKFEKGLPGVKASDFGIKKGELNVISSAVGTGKSMISAPPGIADDMPDYDLKWAIVKLNDGKEYFLKKMNEDGTREWTRDNTVCRLWSTEHEATNFASRYFETGKTGVRGLLTGD